MLGLDVVRVRRCATRASRAALPPRSHNVLTHLSFPSCQRRRIHLANALTRRPEPRLSHPEQNGRYASLASHLASLRPKLIKGTSKEEALKHLEVLRHLLDFPLTAGELIETSEALGLIVSRSPMTPSDIEFPSVVDRLTEHVYHRLSEFSASDLCRLVWTYGCFGPSAIQAKFKGVKALLSQICLRLESDRVPPVPMTVLFFHGLQKMRYRGHSDVTYQILRRTGPMLKYPETEMNDLAKLVLLAGKLRVEEGHQFLRQAGRAVKYRTKEFSDRGLRDFVLGFVFYDIQMMPALFDILSEEVRYRSTTMSVAVLIEFTLALAKIQYMPQASYLESFGRRLTTETASLSTIDIARSLQAMGMLKLQLPDVIESLKEQFIDRCSVMKTADLCHALLGLTRLDALDLVSFEIGLKAVRKELVNGMTKTQRLILHQVLTHAKAFLDVPSVSEDVFPSEWQEACREAWIKDQDRSNEGHDASMLKTVKLLGLEWKQTSSEVGDIGIVVIDPPYGTRPVVLDVIYRKRHCFINQKGRPMPLPWKRWQWSILGRQGYEVLSLNEDEWMQVPKESRLRHLGTKLGFWKPEALIDMENRLGVRNKTMSQI